MRTTLQLLCTAALLTGSLATTAQTVSTFEDISLPGADTTFLDTQIPNGDGVYTFESGNATFYGNISWGSLLGEFNCSNHTDNVTPGFTNQYSNITGSGYEGSENFGLAFVPTDFTTYQTIPVGLRLNNEATGNPVAGFYVTNTTYTYYYIQDNYATGEFWLKLIVRGYNAGVASDDSVVFTLADYSEGNTFALDTWQWVNLSALGNVDSLTFDLSSNDTAGGWGINTPSYFAMDNLTTLDGNCSGPAMIAVTDITDNSAVINWVNSSLLNIVFDYEIAIDESATLEPIATPIASNGVDFPAEGLNANTLYYAHIRTKCSDNSYSAWDTASFTTAPGTGIADITDINISIHPNPTSDILYINSDNPVDVRIFDIQGKEVLQANKTQSIDVRHLAAGAYSLQVYDAHTHKKGGITFIKK